MSLNKNVIPKISVSFDRNVNFEPIQLSSSEDVYKICKTIFDSKTINLYEEFKAVYVDRRNYLIGFRDISRGSTIGTVVNIKLILAIALECNAQGIILVHNHPSSHLEPSFQDREITNKVRDACELLEIQLLDHLIVSDSHYYSFADEESL